MEHTKFVYWLKGFLESNDPSKIDEKKINLIKKKLDSVIIDEEPKASKRVKIGLIKENPTKRIFNKQVC